MPGSRGAKNVGKNIKEFKTGKTYARTKRKFGKAKATKQALAVGLRQAGVPKKKAKKKAKKRATKR
jgi:hypothetical protein